MNSEEVKHKIKDIKEKLNNKRWTDAEVKKILEYLQENNEFEIPTAQIFYRKLLEVTHIDATWNIVRWKVRHLKVSYNKAETWRKSTGAGLLETDEGITSLKDKLRKMCRFYDELHNIFGPKSYEIPFHVFDTGTTNNIAFNSTLISEETMEKENNFFICGNVEESSIIQNVQNDECDVQEIIEVSDYDCASSAPVNILTNSTPVQTPNSATQPIKMEPKNKAVQEFAAKLKRSAPKNALDKLSTIQSERNSHLKEKLDFEKEKFKMEFSLNEKRFAEEVEERKNKYEIKKLEIEKQERIERYEIEMKYKYSSNNQ